MTNRIEEIFQDARELQANALEMLALGKVRNAAEKAWRAKKRASDALVLARPGRNRSGRQRPALGSGCWHPWTKPCGKPTWSGAIIVGRGLSTASASTMVSATPWRTRSAGSGRRPTTSTTPSASPKEMPCEEADCPGRSGSAAGAGADCVCLFLPVPVGGIEVQGSAYMFSGTLQAPGVTSSSDSVTVEGANATFRAPLQEP